MSKKQEEKLENEELKLENEVKETAEEVNKDEAISKLTSELEEQTKRADEYFEHLKRNMAEFDNYKKRMTKEKDGMYKTILSDIVGGFLPTFDNLKQALDSECSDEKYKEGMRMIYEQLSDYLKSQGLEEIEDVGKTFDPNLHEAVMHEENGEKGEKEIVEVFRKGYKIGEKIIRHSMVKVAN